MWVYCTRQSLANVCSAFSIFRLQPATFACAVVDTALRAVTKSLNSLHMRPALRKIQLVDLLLESRKPCMSSGFQVTWRSDTNCILHTLCSFDDQLLMFGLAPL